MGHDPTMRFINWVRDTSGHRYHFTYGHLRRSTLCGVSLDPFDLGKHSLPPLEKNIPKCGECQSLLRAMAM